MKNAAICRRHFVSSVSYKVEFSQLIPFLLFFVIGILIIQPFNARASLSVATAANIQGNAPNIFDEVAQKILDTITFNIVSEIGQSYELIPGIDNTLYVSYSTTPSAFFATVDLSVLGANDIEDDDGDYLAKDNPFAVKQVIYEWEDANGNVISADSTDWLGGNICQSTYKGDSVVTTIFIIQVRTEYGLPSSAEKVLSKSFKVNAKDGICYLQPGVLALNIPNGWPEGGNNASAGSDWVNRDDAYNTEQFTRSKGFNAWATNANGQSFPTTAFPDARFRIIPFGTISNYTYSIISNPNSAVANDARASNASSKAEFKFSDIVPEKNADYVFLVVNNTTGARSYYRFSLNTWVYVVSKLGQWITLDNAKTLCANNGDRLPSRKELSNSYYTFVEFADSLSHGNWYLKNNGYSRAIGEGVMAEWGKIFYYAPGDGNARDMMADVKNLRRLFNYDFYFTNEPSLTKGMNYSVGTAEGNVIVEFDSAYAMCAKY
ncbi:hypothetical protein DES39_1976 [Orbus hercynius]|uniref:Uncharacterized protein n=1 Tax=Orbus hercynius TaxID=593135 RepID=A0A495RBX8_9GAMM|nr:hypothetical protein [Orbus hercynius]RKS84760.1 hypothetical protein DES39_1976 [Orbus hercynius]